MACLAMHLAITQEYLEKHKDEESPEAFFEQAIEPDLQKDKAASHFGKDFKFSSVKEMLENKVDIVKGAKALNLNYPKDRGLFLHILTDYLFYHIIYDEKFEQWSADEIKNFTYQDYDYVTNYVIKKYKIDIPDRISHIAKLKNENIDSMFFNESLIDRFIDFMSSIDLEEAKRNILDDVDKTYNNFEMLMTKQ